MTNKLKRGAGGGYRASASALAELAREIAFLEAAWIHGALGALVDALLLCERERIPPPGWVSQAAAGAIAGIHDDPARRRTARALSQHRANVIHRLRWGAVVLVQDVRRAWREEDAELPGFLRAAGFPEIEIAERVSRARALRWPELARGFNPAEARDDFVTAARLLEGTAAVGSADTIRRSYRLVEAERSQIPHMPAFYLPSDEALRRIGLQDLAGIREGLGATAEAKRARRLAEKKQAI